jgi:hypothetical protein
VVSFVNGCLVETDHLELSRLCWVMLTSWRTLKAFITERSKDDLTDRGDYHVKVDWWYKEARMVKANRSV